MPVPAPPTGELVRIFGADWCVRCARPRLSADLPLCVYPLARRGILPPGSDIAFGDEAMAVPRVFISFDYDHDDDLRVLLAGQAKNPATPFVLQDWSVKEPFTGDWKAKVRSRIRSTDLAIVICGKYTHTLSCLGLASASRPMAFAGWLFVLGVFTAIYHPVGSAMLVSVRYFLGFTVSGLAAPAIAVLHGDGGFALVLGAAGAFGLLIFLAACMFALMARPKPFVAEQVS